MPREKKTEIITLRVTPRTKAVIQARAKSVNKTVTDYLCLCGLGKEIVQVEGLDKVLSELKAQGRNLNQLTTLANMGIIDGFSDGTFRPYAKITRAQFAKIAVGFFETTREDYQGYFTDVDINAWYTEYVEAAARVGLIEGFNDGTFRPNTNITRAQACVIVNRALGRSPDEDRLLDEDEMITWPDNNPEDWFYADMQEATNSHDYTWVTVSGDKVEKWTEKLEQRDWAALEHAWSTAHSAPGGEVTK